jgi:hypothetical protein
MRISAQSYFRAMGPYANRLAFPVDILFLLVHVQNNMVKYIRDS